MDIDGTICEDIPNEESERFATARVIKGAVERVNGFYDAGHAVTFFTSRTEAHRAVTEAWLAAHGFHYHALLMNKPRGGPYYWLDNLPVEVEKFNGSWGDVKG